MTYKFAQTTYLLRVKKVDVLPVPGPRKVARDLKIVFEAYRSVPGRGPVRCDEELIAQHVHQVLLNTGHWHTRDEDDVSFLKELGLPERLGGGDDIGSALIGRWIKGIPGPPGPDGFNPLNEFSSYHPPFPNASVTLSPTPSASEVESADTEPIGHPSDRRSDLDVSPDLILRELGGGGANRRDAAKLVGMEGGRFSGLDMTLGWRQLFFLHLLFTSGQVETLEGDLWTLVREDRALDAFGEWHRKGYLTFGGVDKENELEGRRLAKMWEPVAARLNEALKSQGLFRHFEKTSKSPKYFAVRLGRGAMWTSLPPYDQLLSGQAERGGRSASDDRLTPAVRAE